MDGYRTSDHIPNSKNLINTSQDIEESLPPPTPPEPFDWVPASQALVLQAASIGKDTGNTSEFGDMFNSSSNRKVYTYDSRGRSVIHYNLGGDSSSRSQSESSGRNRLSLDSYVRPKGVRVRLFDDCDLERPQVKATKEDFLVESSKKFFESGGTQTETSGVDSDFDDASSGYFTKRRSDSRSESIGIGTSDFSDSGPDGRSVEGRNSVFRKYNTSTEPDESFISDLQRIRRRLIFDDSSSVVTESVATETDPDIPQELLAVLPADISAEEYKKKLLSYVHSLASKEQSVPQITSDYINLKLELLLQSLTNPGGQRQKPSSSIIDQVLQIDAKSVKQQQQEDGFAQANDLLSSLKSEVENFQSLPVIAGRETDYNIADDLLENSSLEQQTGQLDEIQLLPEHDIHLSQVAADGILQSQQTTKVSFPPEKREMESSADFQPLVADAASCGTSEVTEAGAEMTESGIAISQPSFRTLQLKECPPVDGEMEGSYLGHKSPPGSDLEQMTFDPSSDVDTPVSLYSKPTRALEQYTFDPNEDSRFQMISTEESPEGSPLQAHHLVNSPQADNAVAEVMFHNHSITLNDSSDSPDGAAMSVAMVTTDAGSDTEEQQHQDNLRRRLQYEHEEEGEAVADNHISPEGCSDTEDGSDQHQDAAGDEVSESENAEADQYLEMPSSQSDQSEHSNAGHQQQPDQSQHSNQQPDQSEHSNLGQQQQYDQSEHGNLGQQQEVGQGEEDNGLRLDPAQAQQMPADNPAVTRWVLNIDPNPNPEDDQAPASGDMHAVLAASQHNVNPGAAVLAPNNNFTSDNSMGSQAGVGNENGGNMAGMASADVQGMLGLEQQAAMFSDIIARQMMAMQEQQRQQQQVLQEQLRQLQQQAVAAIQTGNQDSRLVAAEGANQDRLVAGEGASQDRLVAGEGASQDRLVAGEGASQDRLVAAEGANQDRLVAAGGASQDRLVAAGGASQDRLVAAGGESQDRLVAAKGSSNDRLALHPVGTHEKSPVEYDQHASAMARESADGGEDEHLPLTGARPRQVQAPGVQGPRKAPPGQTSTQAPASSKSSLPRPKPANPSSASQPANHAPAHKAANHTPAHKPANHVPAHKAETSAQTFSPYSTAKATQTSVRNGQSKNSGRKVAEKSQSTVKATKTPTSQQSALHQQLFSQPAGPSGRQAVPSGGQPGRQAVPSGGQQGRQAVPSGGQPGKDSRDLSDTEVDRSLPKPVLPSAGSGGGATASIRQQMARDGMNLSPIPSDGSHTRRYIPSSPGGSSAYSHDVSVSSAKPELESEIMSMEQLRHHLQDMITTPFLHDSVVPVEERTLTSVPAADDTVPASLDSMLSFTARYLDSGVNQSSGNQSVNQPAGNQSDWRVLRETADKERYRRKHCEHHITQLQAKNLELQQQLAVAVSTKKKKVPTATLR